MGDAIKKLVHDLAERGKKFLKYTVYPKIKTAAKECVAKLLNGGKKSKRTETEEIKEVREFEQELREFEEEDLRELVHELEMRSDFRELQEQKRLITPWIVKILHVIRHVSDSCFPEIKAKLKSFL